MLNFRNHSRQAQELTLVLGASVRTAAGFLPIQNFCQLTASKTGPDRVSFGNRFVGLARSSNLFEQN